MSDTPRSTDASTDEPRRRDHLCVVHEDAEVTAGGPVARPRTIGRVIAQTALIADGAIARRKAAPPHEARGMGRLLSRFR